MVPTVGDPREESVDSTSSCDRAWFYPELPWGAPPNWRDKSGYGRMFLTSHMAFTLAMEKSLQLINANITQPYWDFMTDTALYGKKWYQSDIWTNDYYGPIDTDGNNQHRVKEGRFADLPTLYDPDGTLYSEYAADTNPYGYVNHPHNVRLMCV